MTDFGFLILTHDDSPQAMVLLQALNEKYDHPPIAWHHDFSKSALAKEQLTDNVHVVEDYVVTGWGEFSLVEAKMKALELLYQVSSPKYYVVLSGADFPVVSKEEALNALEKTGADVFLRSSKIEYGNFDKKWKKQYYDRYCALKLLFRRKNQHGRRVISQIALARHPAITKYFNPFSDRFSCWGGELWYTGTHKSADYLIEFYNEDRFKLVTHYRKTKIPDESIFHTIFRNAENIECFDSNFRYVDWGGGQPHPKTLEVSDLMLIKASSAHFARKFDFSVSASLVQAL